MNSGVGLVPVTDLRYGDWVEEAVLTPVPHRQYVFTRLARYMLRAPLSLACPF